MDSPSEEPLPIRGLRLNDIIADDYDQSAEADRLAFERVAAKALKEWDSVFKNLAASERDDLHRRRFELIKKKNRVGLTLSEVEEFERLQGWSRAEVEREFPGPCVDLEKLDELAELLRKH